MKKSNATHAEIFAWLEAQGAAKGVVSFSGGNDEGSVNSIELLAEDGSKIAEKEEVYIGQKYNPATKNYDYEREATAEEKVLQAMAAPVYAKYGGFAGEFSVSGTVEFDVATKKVKMSGDTEVSQYEPFEEELD